MLDCVENCYFIIQDETQGFHWSKLDSPLHQVVVDDSLCISSDDMAFQLNTGECAMLYQKTAS